MITKPAILIMSYLRHDLTAQVLKHNLNNAGADCGLFVSDMEGISKSTNTMLRRALECGYDGFVICGNDILEPENWLRKRIDFINSNQSAGMVSVPVDYVRHHLSEETVIGNFMISKEVVDKVGAMDEHYGVYGAVDLDYNERCKSAGFKNYYLPNMLANHLHYHDGQELYGIHKPTEVEKTWQYYVDKIGKKDYHIPIIEMKQMEGG